MHLKPYFHSLETIMDIYFHLLAFNKFIEMHGSKNVKQK
jgi:hypothetical protein